MSLVEMKIKGVFEKYVNLHGNKHITYELFLNIVFVLTK